MITTRAPDGANKSFDCQNYIFKAWYVFPLVSAHLPILQNLLQTIVTITAGLVAMEYFLKVRLGLLGEGSKNIYILQYALGKPSLIQKDRFFVKFFFTKKKYRNLILREGGKNLFTEFVCKWGKNLPIYGRIP